MENILLPIKAKHFFRSRYINCEYCPIANAAREFFTATYVNEGVTQLYVGELLWRHEFYTLLYFQEDVVKAKNASFDDTVIRTIELIRIIY